MTAFREKFLSENGFEAVEKIVEERLWQKLRVCYFLPQSQNISSSIVKKVVTTTTLA